MGEQNETTDQVQPAPEPQTPVQASGRMGSASAWLVFGQLMAAAGAVIGFLGLGDHSTVVEVYNFLHSEKALPVIGLVLWAGGAGGLWWRAKGRQEALAFMAALLPNRVAQVQGDLSPKVQAAVDQVTAAGLVSKETLR